MHQNFSIAMGLEAMAFLDQLFAEFTIVVDLPIHHRPDGASLIPDRLMATDRINHTQSPHSKGYTYVMMSAFLVRPSMDKPIEHPVKENRIVIPYEAANTTHKMATPNKRLPTLLYQDSLSSLILLPLLLVAGRNLLRRHVDRLISDMFSRSHRSK
jgi:hypothetical protein